jgi:hypothetical protein
MNKKSFILVVAIVAILISFPMAGQENLSVLVVRGGHTYDTPEFEEMCLSLEGIQADLVLTAHMESMKAADIASKYDAILFLNQNKHYTEYERNKKRYMDLSQLGVGMVFLQFTLASQPEWDAYHDLLGGKYNLRPFTQDKDLVSTYHPGLSLDIEVLDPRHPATKGLEDFNLTDAFYGNIQIAHSVTPLLATDHPGISQTIAWTHLYNNSKVVYIMPGFTKGAYEHPTYRKLISNSLHYVGSRKSD